jgi:crossover junction endodeoxyribonuclease RuvC
MAVAQAQAVAAVAAAHHGLPVSTYSPREVKRAITDHGGSSKSQVQEMVGVLLGLADGQARSPDAADALAVAICHISASRARQIASGE